MFIISLITLLSPQKAPSSITEILFWFKLMWSNSLNNKILWRQCASWTLLWKKVHGNFTFLANTFYIRKTMYNAILQSRQVWNIIQSIFENFQKMFTAWKTLKTTGTFFEWKNLNIVNSACLSSSKKIFLSCFAIEQ